MCEELLNIKIVEEPVITSLGGANANNVLNVYNRNNLQDHSDDGLAAKATHFAANFSGPGYLRKLDGQCFDYFSSKYILL